MFEDIYFNWLTNKINDDKDEIENYALMLIQFIKSLEQMLDPYEVNEINFNLKGGNKNSFETAPVKKFLLVQNISKKYLSFYSLGGINDIIMLYIT